MAVVGSKGDPSAAPLFGGVVSYPEDGDGPLGPLTSRVTSRPRLSSNANG